VRYAHAALESGQQAGDRSGPVRWTGRKWVDTLVVCLEGGLLQIQLRPLASRAEEGGQEGLGNWGGQGAL
jgi:hypothetical protein